jgi:putative flippase GtrA
MTATARLVRSPESGLRGQGVRFILAGGAVAVLYLALTTTLAKGFDLPFQIALAVGYSVSLATHFTLQRFFVWIHRSRFALLWHRQARRYLLLAAVQYGVTALATSQLPAILGVSALPVFLVTAAVVTILNFLIFRTRVFHEDLSGR